MILSRGIWAGLATLLLGAGAQAQSSSCETFKQTLAARIPPEIRGYSMDDVPARTPLPPGAKVIGTCEGGARKIVYRRFGGPPIVASAAAASAPATTEPAPPPAVVAQARETPRPTPLRPVPAPSAPVVPASPASPASAATPAAPALVSHATDAPVPAPPPTVVAVAPIPQAAVATVPSEADTPPPPSGAPPAGDAPFSAHWWWLLLVLPLMGWTWKWVSYRMAYDSAGLPRGPRL